MLTAVNTHAGSYCWMAPERFFPTISGKNTRKPTKASDVYSFAMLVIEVRASNVRKPVHLYFVPVIHRRFTYEAYGLYDPTIAGCLP